MMFMKWKKFALLLGGTAFILVFLVNLRVNLFITSIKRGFIAFIVFFVLGTIIHLILYFLMKEFKQSNNKGQNLDIKSSEKDNLEFEQVYQTSQEESFQPLKFKKIDSDVNENQIIKGVKTFLEDN